jgi:hypothetical protein
MEREITEKSKDVMKPLDRPTPPLTLPLRSHDEIGDVEWDEHLTHIEHHFPSITEAEYAEERGEVAMAWMKEDFPLFTKYFPFLFKKFCVFFR